MFKFKISIPAKVDGTDENLPYMVGNDWNRSNYRSFVRSFYILPHDKTGVQLKTKSQMEDTLKFLMVTFRRQTSFKMKFMFYIELYTPTCSSWTILFFSWKSGRRRRRAGGRLRLVAVAVLSTKPYLLLEALLASHSLALRSLSTTSHHPQPNTIDLRPQEVNDSSSSTKGGRGETIRSRQSTVTHCH